MVILEEFQRRQLPRVNPERFQIQNLDAGDGDNQNGQDEGRKHITKDFN